MTISIILVIFGVFTLLWLIRRAKGQYLTTKLEDHPARQIRLVDVEAFRNLVDPAEEEYLRIQLPPAVFRRIQRRRLRAAIDYVSCAARNAALLLNIAEAARRSSDPATVATAERLIDNAIRLRLYALRVIPRLYIAMLLPMRGLTAVPFADRYEQVARQVILLGIRFPASPKF